MRSLTFSTTGEPAEVLKLTESPVPVPGAGEVRIKTILTPIHNHDLGAVRGTSGTSVALPAIGGSEAVGLVDALGAGVTGFQVGQRVSAGGVQGTWADYFLASAQQTVLLPAAIADETAAQLLAMPLNALSILDLLRLKAGDWLVQNAATGAVGKSLAALAKARGVRVVGLVRRPDAVAELAALGFTNVVSTDAPKWRDNVSALLGDAFFSGAVDGVGGPATNDLVSLLHDGGTLAFYGDVSGQPIQADAMTVIFKQLTIKGFWGMKALAPQAGGDLPRLIGEVLAGAVSGALRLPAGAVFRLSEMAKALAASEAGGRKGKILLRP